MPACPFAEANRRGGLSLPRILFSRDMLTGYPTICAAADQLIFAKILLNRWGIFYRDGNFRNRRARKFAVFIAMLNRCWNILVFGLMTACEQQSPMLSVESRIATATRYGRARYVQIMRTSLLARTVTAQK